MTDEPVVLLELRRRADEVREAERAIDGLILAAKARGVSWRQLGLAMGITGDGVRLRMRRRAETEAASAARRTGT